mmetsp:Transcript_14249/g.51244  ORF Transcript_14249/g.51244 Transcript_14249/m.51244 type:complete len:208 (+) Transcript_14249:559-1182(+)
MPDLVQQRRVARVQLAPRRVRQREVVALHDDDLVRRRNGDLVLLRVVHLVVKLRDAHDGVARAFRVGDAAHERVRVERPRRAAARPRRLLAVREQRRVRELREVVVEAVHGEDDGDVRARGGVDARDDLARERGLPRARGPDEADEDARVAVAVAVEGCRGRARGELVHDAVHVFARGRPRRLDAGERARRDDASDASSDASRSRRA